MTAATRLVATPRHHWADLETHLRDWHNIRYSTLDQLDTDGMASLHRELHLRAVTMGRWTRRQRPHTHRDAT